MSRRPKIVRAEQFVIADESWPEGVFQNKSGYWLRVNKQTYIIRINDWVLTDLKGVKYVVSEAEFAERYWLRDSQAPEPKKGPRNSS